MMTSFELLPTHPEIETRWQSAVHAGMKTARIQLDWASLDLGNGVIDDTPLREQLETHEAQGLSSYVGVYAIDSEGLVVPHDLLDETTATGLVDGRSMDDPLVLGRYLALLDEIVPLIVEHGGYVLSIANEPEGFVEDKPDTNDAINAFYAAAIDHAHGLAPDLAVTVTMTSTVLQKTPVFFDTVVDMSDVVSYNYYCLDLTVTGDAFQFVLRGPVEERVPEDFDTLVNAAAGKEVIFHELGCPAGWDPSVIGTDEETQKAFFEAAFAQLHALPKVRAAVVFLLVDWSDQLFDDFYREPLEAQGLPPVFIDSFDEWLTTSGMITFDGVERPSWAVFMDAVAHQP
jgi:hypothetical protein